MLETIALSYGLIAALAPLAQLRRVHTRNSSDDVSIGWLAAYGGGCVVWLLYGISIASLPLVVCEAVSLVTVTATIVTIARVRSVARGGRGGHGTGVRRASAARGHGGPRSRRSGRGASGAHSRSRDPA